MAKDKIEKTNALRILDARKIQYQTHPYDVPNGFMDGVSVANAIGMKPDQVYKTLVTQGLDKEYLVCVIPVESELDLKKVARYFDKKRVDMIPVKDITPVTGYIKGGCSPVGMKKSYRTAIAIQAEDMENITLSAGKVGLQMTLPVKDLRSVTGAAFADLVQEIKI